jgi:hypothetical protein
MKSVFAQDSRDGSAVVTSGVADLMTSLAVIFILLLVAYMTRVQDGNADPTGGHAVPTPIMPKQDLRHPIPEAKRPSVQTIMVPDAAINFEFGKSTLPPRLRNLLVGDHTPLRLNYVWS